MKERTVQLGGETLSKGMTVVVLQGRKRSEQEITKIGTKRIYLKRYGREEAFGIEDRKQVGCVAGYIPRFCTHTEVAAIDRRRDLMLNLRQLGLQSVDGALRDLPQYPDEALEEVIGILSKYQNTEEG